MEILENALNGYCYLINILGMNGGNFDGFVFGLALLNTNNNIHNNDNDDTNDNNDTDILIYKVDGSNNTNYFGYLHPITALNLAAIIYSNKIRI